MASLSVQDVTVGEADGFVNLIVKLDAPSSSTVTVAYRQYDNTGRENFDYRYIAGTLTFAPGETSKTVRVDLVNDVGTVEGPEHLYFGLLNPTNATISRANAMVQIVDNDTIVDLPRVFVRDVVVDEKAGTASFVVRLGQSLGEASGSPVSVNFATSDGTALAGQDYVARSGTLTFAPGESVKTVVVDLLDDTAAESLERFNLVLSNAVNGTVVDALAVAEIGLSDGTNASQPRISVADMTVGEADGYFDVVVSLHAPSANTVTVDYRQYDNTARENFDYRYIAGTLTFAPGETTKAVRVELVNDVGTAEGPEHLYFGLLSPTNATISRANAMIQIVDNDTIVDTPNLFVRDVVVDEKAGTASFAVRLGSYLGEASGSTITVDYATADATALAGQDYVARSGTLTFAPGESVKTVVVDLIDDSAAEALERFNLVLSNPVNAALGDGVAVAEIGLSEGTNASQPRISVADKVVGEGDGYFDMVVSLHAPSTNIVTVEYRQYDNTARENFDYRYIAGTLTFTPGETTKTVRVELVNDVGTVEGPEHLYFGLLSPTNATISRANAMVQIVDNDTIVDLPNLFVRDVVVDEKAGTASFDVRLGHRLGEASGSTVSVNYSTQDGTALGGQDFIARSGILSFAPGESVKTVVVDLLDDSAAEALERFNLVLSSPVNAVIGDGVAVAEIGLSEGTNASQPRISVADMTVGEGDGYFDMVVSLHAPSTNTVTVDYRQFDNTARENFDYRYIAGTLTFVPGETTKTVRVELVDDVGTVEGAEHLFFGLSGATNATIGRANAMVQVVDNDTIVDAPSLFVRDVVVDEKAGTATFAVRLGSVLGEASGSTVSVRYATTEGTAVAGQDFTSRSGTLTFAPGESVKTVVVDITDDTLAEPMERFNLVLSSPVNAVIGDGVAVAEIGLSEGTNASQPRISVANLTVGEGDGYFDMVVSLHAPSTSAVTVDYRQGDDTARENFDYRYTAGTLVFAPGETIKTVRVELVNDTTVESSEGLRFLLSGPTNATVANGTAVVTVLDNDGERPLFNFGRSNDVYTIDTTAVDFIEAADGGFDVVRSSVSYTLPATLEGVILTGTATSATGTDAANFFQGNSRNNLIDGRGGIDTMAYAGRSSDYTVSGNSSSRTVSGLADGSDALTSIERLRFSDTIQAFDTLPGGNTYGAYAMLNAAFDSAPSTALLSQWTVQLDQLGSLRELARAMIQFYAPGVPNETLVAYLWSTIIETPITAADLSYYTGLVDNGTFTQASLVEFVSTYVLNTDEIVGMVGQTVALDPAWFPLPGA